MCLHEFIQCLKMVNDTHTVYMCTYYTEYALPMFTINCMHITPTIFKGCMSDLIKSMYSTKEHNLKWKVQNYLLADYKITLLKADLQLLFCAHI